MKLAQLQGEVNRLAALGEKLAEVASIPENEYDMLQSVAQGGPATEDIASSQWVALDVFKEIDQIDLALASQAHKMSLLESVLMNHHIEESSQISGKPVTQGWLSSYFGVRKDPFSGEPAMHKGLDFAGIEGDAVITTGAGVVTWASERSGYGNLVEIDHGQGVATRYGHNRTILVKVGDVVEKGQAIAELGNTGRSTGAHVHYELLNNGEATNPLRTVYRTSAN
ncbi:M23 family peptidase [Pseudoalteromonas tunicata]|nr:M23 family peptidase [Pseudoalteromonas tunicata]